MLETLNYTIRIYWQYTDLFIFRFIDQFWLRFACYVMHRCHVGWTLTKEFLLFAILFYLQHGRQNLCFLTLKGLITSSVSVSNKLWEFQAVVRAYWSKFRLITNIDLEQLFRGHWSKFGKCLLTIAGVDQSTNLYSGDHHHTLTIVWQF